MHFGISVSSRIAILVALCFTALPLDLPAGSRRRTAVETLAEGLASPVGVVEYRATTFFVAERDESKGRITRVYKGTREPFADGLENLSALALDPRRGLIIAAAGDTVWVYKVRSGEKHREVVIPLDGLSEGRGGSLSRVDFSVMNRAAYLADTAGRALWSLATKKWVSERIAGPDVFDRIGHGSPAAVLASGDGRRLYIGTSCKATKDDCQAALLSMDLKTGDISVLLSHAEFRDITGLAIHNRHFILADAVAGTLFAVPIRTEGAQVRRMSADGVLRSPSGLIIHDNAALVTDMGEGPDQGRLVLVPLRFSENMGTQY